MVTMGRYHMFKADKEVDDPAVMRDLLRRCRWMSIALTGPEGPYLVTLSYGYDQERNVLYFHTARSGLKLELLKRDPRVCGTVIEDLGYIHGRCDHAYRSLVVFGSISLVEDLGEVTHAFEVLLDHQERDQEATRRRYLEDTASFGSAQILRFDMGTMRCKQGGTVTA